jgi:hypothetical protein
MYSCTDGLIQRGLPSCPHQTSQLTVQSAIAQFLRHRRGEPHRAAAAGHHEPREERQQQAKARADAGDQPRRVTSETVLEVVLGTHRQCPVMTAHNQIFVRRNIHRQMPAALLRCPVQQCRGRGFDAVVDRDREAGRLLAIQTGDHVTHAKRGVDPADEMRPALGDAVLRLPSFIDRQVHDETGAGIGFGIHRQADFPGNGCHAGIARLLHGAPPHRLGPGIEARGRAIQADIRLALDDRRVIVARARRLDRVVKQPLAPHRSHMIGLLRRRYPRDNPDGLDA